MQKIGGVTISLHQLSFLSLSQGGLSGYKACAFPLDVISLKGILSTPFCLQKNSLYLF